LPLIARIRRPIWRVLVALVLCGLLVLLAGWLSGWVAAVVVGVVCGGAILAVATHWDRYVAWQRRRPVLGGLAMAPFYFVFFAMTSSGSFGSSLLTASVMTLIAGFAPPLSQWLRRREERYLETWKQDLGYVVDTDHAGSGPTAVPGH
jgi:hypothetical protein